MKLNLAAANDDRPQVDADFQLPDAFVATYSGELLKWASARTPEIEIDLWDPPDSNVLSRGYQGKVKLRLSVMGNPVTRHMVITIAPDGPQEYERIRLHCEALPKIVAAHRAKAEATRNSPRGNVSAVFVGIDEYFIKRYGLEIREWGRNLKRIGMVKTIVLREGTLSDISPAEDQGAVLLGVKLEAKIEQLKNGDLRLSISPQTEKDDRIIRNHVQKMTTAGIPAVAELVEPPRPGMPFMPNLAGARERSDGGI